MPLERESDLPIREQNKSSIVLSCSEQADRSRVDDKLRTSSNLENFLERILLAPLSSLRFSIHSYLLV